MNSLLPFPVLSASLFVLWLLLNQTLSVGHILLGIAAALAGGWTLRLLESPKLRLRRPFAIGRLVARVVPDIVRSNIAVAHIILGAGRQGRRSGFVHVPLALHNLYGLAALACIITATPGTVWVDFDSETGVLTIHVLDLIDEGEWIRTIRGRYESLLLEIFA